MSRREVSKCVGDQFALFESIITLAMVCRRFDFELDAKFHPDGECGMTTGATIHTTGGLHVKLKRRDGAGGNEMLGSIDCGDGVKCASLGELSDVNTGDGTPESGAASFDEAERAQARDLKEAAVVLGAKTAGASELKSGSGGAKGEKPSIDGAALEEAVKEAEALYEAEAEREAAMKKELEQSL